MPDPQLSVVVPIYDVEPYLASCLESVLQSTLTDIEVICVDDGSTDSSGAIADEFARQDPRVTVVHVENGGLGKARNIGTELARGRYLAFVDSDDRVTPRAYELMCASLESSGSDFASGRVRRLGLNRTWQSGLHSKAIPRAATATHITERRELVYDTTAWNKVFRRSFWDEHHLRFPEGVLYEDMPVTIPAHVLATAVDLLQPVVYEWRERGDGSQSITQRRSELSNLRDRLDALEYVSDFLTERSLDEVLRAHDRKVLTLDIPLYLGVLDIADAEFRELFGEHMQRYLEHVDDRDLERIEPWDRVAFELLRRGKLAETVELVRARKAARNNYDVQQRGTRLYAKLPYLGDKQVGLPRAVYDVTTRLPVRRTVDELSVTGSDLVISGYGFISKVPLNRPWSAVRYLEFRDDRAKERIRRIARPVNRPDLTTDFGTLTAAYDMGGFRSQVPLAQFHAPTTGFSTYIVQIKIVAPGARRGVTLARARQSWMLRGVQVVRPDGALVSAHTINTGDLVVTACRDYALAEDLDIDDAGETLTVRLRFPGPTSLGDGATLQWRSEDHADPIVGRLVPDPADPRCLVAVCDLRGHRVSNPAAPQRLWRATVEIPSADGPARSVPLVTDQDRSLADHEDVTARRELSARVGARGLVILADRNTRARALSARWDGGSLQVRLALPAAQVRDSAAPEIVLTTGGDRRVEPAKVELNGTEAFVAFDVLDPLHRRSIRPGTWTLRVGRMGSDESDWLMVEVDDLECSAGSAELDQPRADVRVTPQSFTVVVRPIRIVESGQYNQNRLRKRTYLEYRSKPLSEAVLFQSWGGKQYSDSPRALFEEMQRQGRGEPAIWVRRDSSVEFPDDVPSVLWGSSEYYEALATARYVISNDAMPPYYVKRPGSSYLQTWHGTPLKRIGFDIENAQFGNVNYLDEFAVEVTKWDYLISPNRFSTEIFQRAFDYHGEVLETGYPRNDAFYASDAEQRRDEVRARLGLHPSQRAILWAPTWREDQRDSHGAYSLSLPFDPATWAHVLGPDDVLLFRGHQLLQGALGARLGGLEQVHNVTMYPDIQELYLAADLLITDYSSVMFDFANTRRPMIFYAWDLEHYRDRLRGFYLDFEETVPGPVVTDFADLQQTLAGTTDIAAYADKYARFVERFCGLEDGRASARALNAIFGS